LEVLSLSHSDFRRRRLLRLFAAQRDGADRERQRSKRSSAEKAAASKHMTASVETRGLRAPEDRRAGTLGVTSTAMMLGNMAGPLLGGTVAGVFGLRAVFIVSGIVLFAIYWTLWPRLQEPDRIPEAVPATAAATVPV
jgi:hypothetical protein